MGHSRRLGSADLQWCGGRCKLELLRRYLPYGTEPQVGLIYHTFCCTTHQPNIHSLLMQRPIPLRRRVYALLTMFYDLAF